MRHLAPKQHKIKRKLILPVLLSSVVALIAVTACAYLFVFDGLTNTLRPAPNVTASVTDDYRVAVSEIHYTVYIRAAVTVNWASGSNIYAQAPVEGTDYTLAFNESDWFYHNGFYYCKKPIASGEATSNLLSGFKQSDNVTAPKDYTLSLTMVAQAIQAKGTTDNDDIPAVTDAWGVKIDNSGNLVAP